MQFKNYSKMNALKRSKVFAKLNNDCIGPCNTSMIKMGLCKCKKTESSKSLFAPFFEVKFWGISLFALMVVSFFIRLSFLNSIIVILLVWVYFQYFKDGQSNFQRKRPH